MQQISLFRHSPFYSPARYYAIAKLVETLLCDKCPKVLRTFSLPYADKNFSSSTPDRLRKKLSLNTTTINPLCIILNSRVEDIAEFIVTAQTTFSYQTFTMPLRP